MTPGRVCTGLLAWWLWVLRIAATSRYRVGHSVTPVTLDVSLSVLADAACGDGNTVLLLDTPGLDAPNRNAAWDAQIMVCAQP
jgi:hypothetical protein